MSTNKRHKSETIAGLYQCRYAGYDIAPQFGKMSPFGGKLSICKKDLYYFLRESIIISVFKTRELF